MFISRSSNEMPVDFSLTRQGFQLWSAVEFGLEMPWYYATIRYDDDGVSRTRCLMTTAVTLLSRDRLLPLPGAELTQVILVSPGWLNGSGTWQMAPLREVRSGECDGKELLMYELADGSWLTEENVPLDNIEEHRTMFRFEAAPGVT